AVLHPIAEAEERLEVLPAHGFERNAAMRRATRLVRGRGRNERERGLLRRAPGLRRDRDEIALVELVDLVTALHRENVGTVEGLALKRQPQLREPSREAATAGELRDDDAPRLPTDGLRGHDLVRPRVLEHAVLVDARGVRERVRADDGLVRLHRDPGELADEPARRDE